MQPSVPVFTLLIALMLGARPHATQARPCCATAAAASSPRIRGVRLVRGRRRAGNEKLALQRRDGWAKLVGVGLCVGGALVAALVQGRPVLAGSEAGHAHAAAAAALESGLREGSMQARRRRRGRRRRCGI